MVGFFFHHHYFKEKNWYFSESVYCVFVQWKKMTTKPMWCDQLLFSAIQQTNKQTKNPNQNNKLTLKNSFFLSVKNSFNIISIQVMFLFLFFIGKIPIWSTGKPDFFSVNQKWNDFLMIFFFVSHSISLPWPSSWYWKKKIWKTDKLIHLSICIPDVFFFFHFNFNNIENIITNKQTNKQKKSMSPYHYHHVNWWINISLKYQQKKKKIFISFHEKRGSLIAFF